MRRERLFIGRPVYWVLLVAVVAVLAYLGSRSLHVRDFVLFQFLVLGIGVALVLAVVALYRPGERATRDSLEDDSP
ncbi:MAG: hypothetical protein H6934_01910 [Burkholderiaceae bacterium]|nr:hypothetical protein [Burkholderiaceae bacterium]